ncbi:MAG: type II secretion system protein [Candidatus Dojkabacteria bacterium]|nr:type II secretion system protein [Candidatus Dojkabacteria bacterium]
MKPTSDIKTNAEPAGFSLVEILVALGLFGIIAGSVALFASDSFRASRNAQMKLRASSVIQEITNAVLLLKDELGFHIHANTF